MLRTREEVLNHVVERLLQGLNANHRADFDKKLREDGFERVSVTHTPSVYYAYSSGGRRFEVGIHPPTNVPEDYAYCVQISWEGGQFINQEIRFAGGKYVKGSVHRNR